MESNSDISQPELVIQDEPHVVFLDTSIFENLNFGFGGDRLSELVQWCREGVISLALTEVTVEEVKRRIRKDAERARKAVAGIKNDLRFIGHDHDVSRKLRDRSYYEDLASEVVTEFDVFLKETSATVLETDSVRASEVFRKYFAVAPPFSLGAKEKEFPDAFAFEALLQYAKAQQKSVHVVSSDKDFSAACQGQACLNHAGKIDPILESAIGWSLATRPALIDACHNWVHENFKQLSSRIEEGLKDVTFELDAPAGRILSFEVEDLEFVDQKVIKLDETHAVISVLNNASIKFVIEYAAEGEGYYDADDRLIIPYEDVSTELDANLEFNVLITANIEMPYPTTVREVKLEIADEILISPDCSWYVGVELADETSARQIPLGGEDRLLDDPTGKSKPGT